MALAIDELKRLPVAERIKLVEDLWDSIALEDGDVPLTGAQLAELDRRRAALEANPASGISWSEVKSRLLAGQR
jgi:putative addiction module component (TIGR02574 family)